MKKFIILLLINSPVIANAQNVGVGTSNPVTKLNIESAADTPTIPGAASTGILRIGVGELEGIDIGKMSDSPFTAWIQAGFDGNTPDPISLQPMGGNTGIGTTTPAHKLDVNGDINLTGALRINGSNGAAGQVLTSNGSAAPTWTNSTTSGSGSNIGYGVWGDCATNGNISEYFPVTDPTGATQDNFGFSVSISGNFAIVGALLDDVGTNFDQGSASIYQFNGSNWVLMQKLTDVTGAAEDHFGRSVSISGNYAIVGAHLYDVSANTDQGSASIYQYNGSSWVLMQKLTDATGAAGDNFGYSVSISGNYAIVGALLHDVGANADQGSASIYQYNGSSWVLMQKLTDAVGDAGDGFGTSVSISGNYAMVGAVSDDDIVSIDQGSASIYQYNGSSWVFMQKLIDTGGAAGDTFGGSVSISGNYAIVGAWNDDVEPNLKQGSAIIFGYNGSSWVLMQKLTDATGASMDFFGVSVSISGNYAMVGAYNDAVGANGGQGSASLFQRVGLGWQKLQYITDPGGYKSNNFGRSTAIDHSSRRFIIGVPHFGGISGKVVFGKIN